MVAWCIGGVVVLVKFALRFPFVSSVLNREANRQGFGDLEQKKERCDEKRRARAKKRVVKFEWSRERPSPFFFLPLLLQSQLGPQRRREGALRSDGGGTL